MANKNEGEVVSQQLRDLWSSYVRCSSSQLPEKTKFLELFMVQFLATYHVEKGDLKKISSFVDVYSISNVLTSEFQSAVLLKCEDECEKPLVDYLCHGQGLLLLQMLCILASKVAGSSLELANLLVSLLPVVLRVPLQHYDCLYGLELIFADFDNHWWDTKSTSCHTNFVKEKIFRPFQDHLELEINSSSPQEEGTEADELVNAGKAQSSHIELLHSVKSRTDSPNTTEDSDVFTSVTSITDLDSPLSTSISECSDTEIPSNYLTASTRSGTTNQIEIPSMSSSSVVLDGDKHPVHTDSCLLAISSSHCSINSFELSILLLAILENLTCHGNVSLSDCNLLMHTSGQLIDIVFSLSDARHKSAGVFCEWEPGAVTSVHLATLRTVFSILYTACRNPKAAKQLSKTSYVQKLLQVIADGCLDKEFLTTIQHFELAKLVTGISDEEKEPNSKLLSSDVWSSFQNELLLGCSLHGLLLFVMTCIHYGTLVNSTLYVLCHEIFEQFSSNGGFDFLVTLLLKLDEVYSHEVNLESMENDPNFQLKSFARRIEQYPRNLSNRIVRNLGKMISMLKKGKTSCKSSREASSRKTSVVSSGNPVTQDDVYEMCGVYLPSYEVEESSESAADMEYEKQRQDQLPDLCTVLRPAITLLTVFKDSRNSKFRLSILKCLEKVGICPCVSPDALVTTLLSRFVDQHKDLQDVILRITNHMVLTEIDVMYDNYDVLRSPTFQFKTGQRFRTKSAKESPYKSDSGFSASDLCVQMRDLASDRKPNWACLSQYCALLSYRDTDVAVEVAKALKPLAILGSKHLKAELFRMVVLPCMLRFDGIFTDEVVEPLRKIRARTWTGTSTSEWLEQRGKSFKGNTFAGFGVDFSEQVLGHDEICAEVLELCICMLTSLLAGSESRALFLDCGGLNELQSFLALPQLQEPVIQVLEFLADVENHEAMGKRPHTESDVLSAGSQESSGDKCGDKVCCRSFLSLLQFTTSFVDEMKSPELPHITSCHRVESSLGVYVWRSCLRLLVSNELFGELFLEGGGVVFSWELLHLLLEIFHGAFFTHHTEENHGIDIQCTKELVSLFESVMAVCIRMAHTKQWKNVEALPNLDHLVEEVRKLFSHSETLQRSLSKGLSECFLKASTWQLEASEGLALLGSEIIRQREVVLRKTSHGDSQEEWSNLLDDDDDETDGNQKAGESVVEEGYDADQEADSDRSDETEHKSPRNKKQARQKKRSQFPKQLEHMSKGLVIYPRICNVLFQLLKVCYGSRVQEGESESVGVVHHAVENLLLLLSDCEENCRLLCQHGFLGVFLECFGDVMIRQEQSLQGLQTLVMEVFVCLACHNITAAELWDFLALFNSPDPPVHLLSSALSEVAARASANPGPAFLMSFPYRAKESERRATTSGTVGKAAIGKGKKIRGKMSLKIKSLSPQPSDGDKSSETDSIRSGSSASSRIFQVSGTHDKYLKRVHKKSKSSMEGSKRRGSSKRSTRKQLGSSPTGSSYSADYELTEVLHFQERTHLPSPFLLHAVQLPFRGSLPRSERGFSIAMWICLNSPSLGTEVDDGLKYPSGDSPGQLVNSMERTVLSRKERIVHLCSVGCNKILFEIWIFPSEGAVLIRWTKNHKSSSTSLEVLKQRMIRLPALTNGQWHHLVVSFTQSKVSAEEQKDTQADSLPLSELLIVVDGTESTVHDLGPPLLWHEEAKFTLSTLLLGHVTYTDGGKSPREVLHEGYQIGNVFVFAEKPFKISKLAKQQSSSSNDWLVEKGEAFYLYSLGPNSASMGQLSKDFNMLASHTSNDPTQSFMEAANLWSRLAITEQAVAANLPLGFLTSPHVVVPDLELSLKKRLAAVYSPACPLRFQQYSELLTSEERQGRPASLNISEQRLKQSESESWEGDAKISSGVEPHRQQTLLESAHDVGGIGVFIFLFAKVVEQTQEEKTQAEALSVVLSLQYFSVFHARAMDEESGFALLKRILLSPECKIGYHTLKVLMEAACDSDVFKPTNLADDPIMLNIDSTAVVRNVAIFQHFLLNWKIWERAKQGVLEMLLATIDILVHGSHSYYTFNIIQFQKAQLVQQILIGCQERQSEECKEIPRVISSLYVNIIQNVMGNPPDLTVLKSVCEFLIAVHPTNDIIRLHAPSRCYLREHSLDISLGSNRSLPAASSSISSPRTTPVRSTHSPSPFQFTSPARNPSRTPMSRSLSFESIKNKDLQRKLADPLRVPEKRGLLKTSSRSVTELSKSVTSGLEAGGQTHWSFHETPKGTMDDRDVFQLSVSVEMTPGSSGKASVPTEVFSVPKGNRNLSVIVPQHEASSSEGLSSSSLVLHGSPFRESDPRMSPSPLRSAAVPLGISYPGVRPIPGSNPMVIRKYESVPSYDAQSSFDPTDYDFINDSDFSSLQSSVVNPSSNDDYVVVEGFPGIQSSTRTYCPTRSDSVEAVDAMIKLRLGLMKLLEKKLFNLPSEHVPAVIGEVLKAEYILVWAYHDSDDVRELAIRILFQFLQKAEPKRFDQFLRIHGFHLLANQLYDHPVTKLLLEGCLSLLVDRPVDLNKDYDYSGAEVRGLASSVRPKGVVPLMALLENSVLKPSLFHLLIQHLCQLFIKVDELCLQAVDNGLLETLCNVIYGLCTLRHRQRKPSDLPDLDAVMEDFQQFVVCIVRKACSTNGDLYFQMFEDMLIALENLEEQDHKKRDHDPSTSYCARYFRLFAIQVALHFFQEVSKGERPVGGKKTKPSGLRLSFRGPDSNADPVPAFTPVSSWVNLDRDQFRLCLDPSQLKQSPTSANSNEQTRRFQITCQLAVHSIVYCKTFFLPEDFIAFHFTSVAMDVHEVLRPGMVRVAGAAIEKEFAQFVFSLLLEIFDACLDGRKREIYKLFIVSKDHLKAQLGKLLVFLLNPSQDLDLSYFALNLVHHPRAKKIIENVLTTSGGSKLRQRAAVYVLKILDDAGLTLEQKKNAENFKALMGSLNLQSMRWSADESKLANDEFQMWDPHGMMQWQKQRSDGYKRLDKRTEELRKAISTVAKDVTRVVVEIQDTKRQALLKHTRDALSAEVQIRKKWRQLIERLIHERSVWYDAEHFPSSWRLDPTEGPDRVRCRLQRFHLDIVEKYLMKEHCGKKSKGGGTPLSYLFEDTTTSSKKNVYYIFDTPDTIRFLHHCKNITLDNKINGVLLIGESHMYFVGEEATQTDTDITQILLGNKDAISISWLYEEIQEIRTRRYCLQDNGLEIFLNTGRTYLLAFDTKEDREKVLEQFKQRHLPWYDAPQYEHLMVLTNRWRMGQMTNFQYLTELNKMAGRSFNDLMQYPVFPFVLANFSSDVLDLNDVKNFRDLSRPIAVQNQSKERKYRENFRWLQEEYERMQEEDPMSAPYHYGCHYSNSGTVLHFLVRMPPFTKMFLQYQDRSFDIPDRTFHSMATTWRLSSFESATDVKELIPEFFFLPEFLENREGFDFGLRQNGQRVMDVEVPQWAKGSTRLFTMIHRQALDSEYVSQNLNQWIDLVFGYKQTGREAIDAINVFHPATYYGVDVNAITDPVRQKALKTMIETYGQTPQQLFTFPHSPRPQSKPQLSLSAEGSSLVSHLSFTFKGMDNEPYSGLLINRLGTSLSSDTGTLVGSAVDTLTEIRQPVNTVEGLKWGQYVGSPAMGAPAVGFTQALNTSVHSLVCLKNDYVFVLGYNCTLLTVHQTKPGESDERLIWSAVLSWGYMDGGLRVCTSPESAPVCLMEHHTPDKITCCAVTDGCKLLFIATSTGTLSVLPVKYNPAVDTGMEVLGSRVRLHGHKDYITCMELCQAFSIVVSGSRDKTAIIWDLNRLSYVRCLEHSNTVASLAISKTTGDIGTVSHTMKYVSEESTIEEGSVIKLWTVNGRFISQAPCELLINCLEFSAAPEGISVNVIATGLSNGAIRLWSTWDLSQIRDIAPDQYLSQVASLTFSEDSQRLFAVNTNGKLVAWQRRDKIYTKPPTITVFPRT
ncbi:lysosomal-trafficking regulator-like isoform X2 [Stylophora pistillata]|uniref:lysosomal-trafficking regulator-like isoform X2 n=1 Tax=Stylophora pistillata TaxID=50429 RepID=UPI000C046A3F|nr:lysosomal-trafficking regulator-like isoform X2 [Stylophora pistillata]